MKTRNLMIEASVSALILASLSMAATPAWAQDTGATSSDDTAAAKPAKAKDKSDDVATDIIITARRKALADAISIKKNSDTIVDSVTADEAGKLPDNSITEVLQRLPGVSISRFGGTNGGSTAFQIEGTGLTVRGLPFNSSMLNGQQLFSANGASSFSWNEITPELMSGVDVYKATRADLIEGGPPRSIFARICRSISRIPSSTSPRAAATAPRYERHRPAFPPCSPSVSTQASAKLASCGILPSAVFTNRAATYRSAPCSPSMCRPPSDPTVLPLCPARSTGTKTRPSATGTVRIRPFSGSRRRT